MISREAVKSTLVEAVRIDSFADVVEKGVYALAALVAVGDELLAGERAEGNLGWLARELSQRGWRVAEAGGEVGLLAIGSGLPVLVAPVSGAGAMPEVITGLVRAHDLAAANALAGCLDDPPMDRSLVSLDRLTTEGELVIASGFETPGAALARRLGMLAHTHVLRLIRITDLTFTGEMQDDPAAPDLPAASAICLDACLPPDAIARVLRSDWSQPR